MRQLFLLLLLCSKVAPFLLESPQRSLEIARRVQENIDNASFQGPIGFLASFFEDGFKFEDCRGKAYSKSQYVAFRLKTPKRGTVTEARSDSNFVIYKMNYPSNNLMEVMIRSQGGSYKVVRAQRLLC